MAEVQGTCDERFEAVRAALEAQLASGEELGASVFLDLDGETAVDLWGGFRDEARTTPWTEDTITNVWSTTKTVTSLAALKLVDREAYLSAVYQALAADVTSSTPPAHI